MAKSHVPGPVEPENQEPPSEDERQRLLEAERANRVKDEFLATLSHELRTPLNAILGWTQLLLTRQLSPEDTDRALRTIRRSAEAQARVIDDILDVSRLVAGKLQLNVRPMRVATGVYPAIETVRPAADARGIRLRVAGLDEDHWIVADPDRLQQIVWNLLSNAVKFTPPGGTVEVTVRADEEWAEITVRDSGAGIAPHFVPALFDRFRQADPSTTRRHGGLGLGLALVRHLVELHGGTVRAHSAGEGQGATFVVKIPSRPQRSAAGDNAATSGRHAPGGSVPLMPSLAGVHVLVVEGRPAHCEQAIAALERLGARVSTVARADEAVAVVERERPNVLLADVEGDDRGMHALVRRVRDATKALKRRLPIVAIARYAEPADEPWTATAGFDACLAWPPSPVIVAVTIARLAGRLRAR